MIGQRSGLRELPWQISVTTLNDVKSTPTVAWSGEGARAVARDAG